MLKDLSGQRFGKLTVMHRGKDLVTTSGRKLVRWECRCDCGNMVTVASTHLHTGDTLSCGCLGTKHRSTAITERNRKHDLSRTRIYHLYQNMKYRCYNPNASNYEQYGGRGIAVCDEWLGESGFEHFYEWALSHGYHDNLSIDRIDVDGNYEPGNCRWADEETQHNNTRKSVKLTYHGKTQSAGQWAKELGIDRHTIYDRIKKGKPIEEILRGKEGR